MKQLANSYAIKFTSRWMLDKINELEGNKYIYLNLII